MFFKNPLGDGVEIPAFITFPSLKDQDWSRENPNKTSVQILIMGEYAWFEKYIGELKATKIATKEGKPTRLEGYEDLKKQWTDKCLALFLKYFPKVSRLFYSHHMYISFYDTLVFFKFTSNVYLLLKSISIQIIFI